MYSIDQILHVHLEISSLCNANCPLCPRNFYGYPFNDGFDERNMTLAEVKQIFKPDFVLQLKKLYINGNFGDAVMNPETVEIIQWFKSINPDLGIRLSTNGAARDSEFWTNLAHTGAIVCFCIDGLKDTHSLYRQNTRFDIVMQNAATFIAAGGHAQWKIIKFAHNEHQIPEAEQRSKELGFKDFIVVTDGRDQGPVYNKKGELVFVMGKPDIVDFEKLYNTRKNSTILLEDIVADRQPSAIKCEVKEKKSVYINSVGEVYPCCFLGFNPLTYGHGNYHQAANNQFRHLIVENNALKHDLSRCISWFNNIEKTWTIPTFEEGRLVICNDVCGQTK